MNHKMKAMFIGLSLLLLGQISYADDSSGPPKSCADYTASAECASMKDGFVCIWSNGACVEDKDDY